MTIEDLQKALDKRPSLNDKRFREWCMDSYEDQVDKYLAFIDEEDKSIKNLKTLFASFRVEYDKQVAKERSLRKLWEDFDLQDYDNDDVIEWYNESKKVFAEDFAAESTDKRFILVSSKQVQDKIDWMQEHGIEENFSCVRFLKELLSDSTETKK